MFHNPVFFPEVPCPSFWLTVQLDISRPWLRCTRPDLKVWFDHFFEFEKMRIDNWLVFFWSNPFGDQQNWQPYCLNGNWQPPDISSDHKSQAHQPKSRLEECVDSTVGDSVNWPLEVSDETGRSQGPLPIEILDANLWTVFSAFFARKWSSVYLIRICHQTMTRLFSSWLAWWFSPTRWAKSMDFAPVFWSQNEAKTSIAQIFIGVVTDVSMHNASLQPPRGAFQVLVSGDLKRCWMRKSFNLVISQTSTSKMENAQGDPKWFQTVNQAFAHNSDSFCPTGDQMAVSWGRCLCGRSGTADHCEEVGTFGTAGWFGDIHEPLDCCCSKESIGNLNSFITSNFRRCMAKETCFCNSTRNRKVSTQVRFRSGHRLEMERVRPWPGLAPGAFSPKIWSFWDELDQRPPIPSSRWERQTSGKKDGCRLPEQCCIILYYCSSFFVVQYLAMVITHPKGVFQNAKKILPCKMQDF